MGLLLVRLFVNLVKLCLWPLWALGQAVRVLSPAGWLVIRLHPRVTETPARVPGWARWIPGYKRAASSAVSEVRELVRQAAGDRTVLGVVVEMPPIVAGWATCESLRSALRAPPGSNMPVAVHLSMGGGHKELFVASGAHKISTMPTAALSLTGLSIQMQYLGALLQRLGIEVQGVAVGKYKTFAEPFQAERMSEPQRQQMVALLESYFSRLKQGLRDRLGDPEQAERVFETAVFAPREALEKGLVDHLAYEDELPQILGTGDKPARLVQRKYRSRGYFAPLARRPFLARIDLHGAIVSTAPKYGSAVDADRTIAALRKARRDGKVLGVLLHIDSPGGSALASDRIHREVKLLAENKPVVACFGNVAASGGYYVAAPAAVIVAQPMALTGSIGVAVVRPSAEQLLRQVGVHTETLRASPHADMMSPFRRLSGEEAQLLEKETKVFYDRFIQVVAEGRNRSPQDVEQVAQGRVWAAKDALGAGLVDRLGGLREAEEALREALAHSVSAAYKLALRPYRASSTVPLPFAAKDQRTAHRRCACAFAELIAQRERVAYLAVDLRVE